MVSLGFIITEIISIIFSGANLVIVLFHCLCITDLQTDQINPIDFVRRVNKSLLPEFIVHILLTIIFVPKFLIFELIYTIPLLIYYIYCFVQKQKYYYNAVTVFDVLNKREMACYCKIVYYLIFIFVLVGRILYHVITQS